MTQQPGPADKCRDCTTQLPPGPGGIHRRAKEAGWTRCYGGSSGSGFRCLECQGRKPMSVSDEQQLRAAAAAIANLREVIVDITGRPAVSPEVAEEARETAAVAALHLDTIEHVLSHFEERLRPVLVEGAG